MDWTKDHKVYCICEGTYSENITKRKGYIIQEIGSGTKEDKIRIKGNQNRLVWIPKDYFVEDEIPHILSITIDDEIKNPIHACIEVTIIFSDGKKYWSTFTTPQHLNKILNEHREYITGRNFIFLQEINEILIKKTIHHLDRQNELIKTCQDYT